MKQNVTLILSGGGARGLAHIGVIEELESRGYVINSIAGTSMGALVGGVYAAGKLNEARLHIFLGSQKDKRKKLTYFYLITNTIAFATDHLSKMIMQNDPPDILIEISRHSAGIYDYFKAEELIETGKYSAKTKLDSIN